MRPSRNAPALPSPDIPDDQHARKLAGKDSEVTAQRRILAGKARTRANIGEIENEIIDSVAFVFERCRNRQTFAGLKKGKHNSAARRRAVSFDQTETPPGITWRCHDRDGAIVFKLIALTADHRECLALRRLMKSNSMRVHLRRDFNLGKIDARRNRLIAPTSSESLPPFVNSGMRGSTSTFRNSLDTVLARRILRSHFTGATLSPPFVMASGISRPYIFSFPSLRRLPNPSPSSVRGRRSAGIQRSFSRTKVLPNECRPIAPWLSHSSFELRISRAGRLTNRARSSSTNNSQGRGPVSSECSVRSLPAAN